MTGLENALGKIIRNLQESDPIEEGDYLNEDDGLIYCGKCHTPRQYVISLPAIMGTEERKLKVPVDCECRKREKERREELRKIESIKANSLMDDKFRDSTFAAFKKNSSNARQFKMCRRYAEHFDEMRKKNQGLLFYGDVGTGKTYMAACIANYLMENLTTCVMTSFVKMLQGTQRYRNEEDEEKSISRLNRASLLIIDDLGAERSTDYSLEKVYNIVDSRYRARKPMILTTNLTLRDMQGNTDIRYTRIYDRIFEVCYPIEFTGISWRKEEAARRYDEMTEILEGGP